MKDEKHAKLEAPDRGINLCDWGRCLRDGSDLAERAPHTWPILTLTVDMNGIVHPCTHPEGKPAPETEEEMMVEIFKYTERVVNMARPRKVLMMAIGTL